MRLRGADAIYALLEKVLLDEPAGIRLISVHQHSVSMYVTNSRTGTLDLFVFFNMD